jgi:hypothetical protein
MFVALLISWTVETFFWDKNLAKVFILREGFLPAGNNETWTDAKGEY